MKWGQVLKEAVAKQITPGGVACVASGNGLGKRLSDAQGHLALDSRACPVDETTIYDLASLTKLLATTPLTARALVDGLLQLDECPWPAWPHVSIEQILTHTSGLIAWHPFYEEAIRRKVVGLPAGRNVVLESVMATKPEHSPNSSAVYSDLGFIALGALLEERYQERLDHLTTTFWEEAIGDHSLRFISLFEQGYHPDIHRVAPTEHCSWRLRYIRGQVHDDNCFAMGGIAGHAGLFGAVSDVERAGRYLLSCIKAPANALEETLHAFATASGQRPLGFDKADPEGSTGGALSAKAVGHLGFTGTSLWIDAGSTCHPDGMIYVLLTNRVYQSRNKKDIFEVRQAFHREAVDAFQE